MDIPKLHTKTVGLDFDACSFRTLIRRIIQAKNLKFVKKMKLYRTNKGYHFILTLDKEINLLQHFILRALVSDDAYRIRFGLKRLYLENGEGFDVLFDIKQELGKTPVLRKDISGLIDLVDTEKELDEIVNEVKEKVELEEKIAYLVVFPIYTKDLESVVNQLEERKLKSFFIKFAFSEKDDFFLVFRGLYSYKQAMGKGMKVKQEIQTSRNTFWIKKVTYELVGSVR